MKRSIRRRTAIVLVGATAALGITAGPFVGAASAGGGAIDAFHSCSSTSGGIFNAWIRSYFGNGQADNSNGISQFGIYCIY